MSASLLGRVSNRGLHLLARTTIELSPDEIPYVSSEATGHWDSLSMVTPISLIQEEFDFDIEIRPDAFPDLNSFGAFRDYIESASCRSKEL